MNSNLGNLIRCAMQLARFLVFSEVKFKKKVPCKYRNCSTCFAAGPATQRSRTESPQVPRFVEVPRLL